MEKIKTVSEYISEGERPEILFWVGCAGSFDSRARQVSLAFANLMQIAGIRFAILGDEEKCTGDPARRAGNEFLFQLLALQNIETLKNYTITKIVTTCPHCFNTLKNDYPALGGHYEVVHHTVFLNALLRDGRLKLAGEKPQGTITYHDSCYLGRVNGIYEDPREIMQRMNADLREMKRSRAGGLCCGAGGGQMFKEDEPGSKRINLERIEEALSSGAGTIISNCPFCLTMLTDGVKAMDKQDKVMVYDLAELILQQKSP